MRLFAFWARHFRGLEFVASIAGASLVFVTTRSGHGAAIVDAFMHGNRAGVYGSLASISGALFGFVITALTIVIGFASSEKLAVLRQSEFYSEIWATYKSGIRALAAATVASLAGLVVDRDAAPVRLAMYLCVWTVLLAALRMFRCVWILEHMTELVTQPSKAQSGADHSRVASP
jgi:hypothetical protein